MNATSLYASTCRLIILADATDKSTWSDLFRLLPYLRQALSCSVCEQLLRAPLSPGEPECQHHVCTRCKGGRKKLKPSCDSCKLYDNYIENEQLRILLQCYKKLCQYFMGTDIYKLLLEKDEIIGVNGRTVASSALIELIHEGAGFDDDYKSPAELLKPAYSILPCVYSNSSAAQTQAASTSSTATESSSSCKESPSKKPVANGSSTYSVMYAGSGNKITIKRKAVEEYESSSPKETVKEQKETISKTSFKKPTTRIRPSRKSTGKRKGCRCGNATATPGKLTCCGQRCPCYVESKPCTECKCKGCRNPHRADGLKVRPHIIKVENSQNSQSSNADSSPSCSGSIDSTDNDSLTMETAEDSSNPDLKDSKIYEYSKQLQSVSPTLPANILMNEDSEDSPDDDDDDEGNEEDEESSPLEWQVNSPPDTQDSAVSHSPPSYISGSPQEEEEAQSDVEVDV